MPETTPCSTPDCDQPGAAALDLRPFCVGHFISNCYEQLDEYACSLEQRPLPENVEESAREFLSECARQATDLAEKAEALDNLERARLLDILLSAADLSRHLRRSLRKVISIRVRLCCEKLGRAWEEDTETRIVSRHGALLECQHPVESGETLRVVRKDRGREALARVAWSRRHKGGKLEIGIEFLNCDNFWELD